MKPQAFLYVGGSYPQLPGIRQIKSLGVHTVLTDASPQAPGRPIADEFFAIDAADVDGIVSLAKNLNATHDLIGAYGVADYAYPAIGAVYDALRLPLGSSAGFSRLIDKAAAQDSWQEAGVSATPRIWAGRSSAAVESDVFHRCLEVDAVVVRPSGAHASRGVSLLTKPKPADLRHSISEALNHSGLAIVDEYVDGQVCNIDGLMVDGDFHPISITHRHADPRLLFLPYFQTQLADAETPNAGRYYDLAERAARAVGYTDGPFTVDGIVAGQNIHALEISPHFHLIALEAFRGNGEILKAWVAYLAGNARWSRHLSSQPPKAGGLYMMRADKPGRITALTGLDDVKCDPAFADLTIRRGPGQDIETIAGADSLCALVWLVADSDHELDLARKRLHEQLVVVIV